MADQIITELPIKQQSGFNLNSYLLGLDADSYRILISDLAKKIVEDYSGSTLAGSAQAVKTAFDSIDSTIDNIDSTIGNTEMGTTATTITGAIAEHETDISQLNSKTDTITAGNVDMLVSGTSSLLVRQFGHVVSIWGYIQGLSLSANTATDIAKITGVLLPADALRIRGSIGNNAYSVGSPAYIYIGANGTISATPSVAGSTIYFNATYIR